MLQLDAWFALKLISLNLSEALAAELLYVIWTQHHRDQGAHIHMTGPYAPAVGGPPAPWAPAPAAGGPTGPWAPASGGPAATWAPASNVGGSSGPSARAVGGPAATWAPAPAVGEPSVPWAPAVGGLAASWTPTSAIGGPGVPAAQQQERVELMSEGVRYRPAGGGMGDGAGGEGGKYAA